MIYAENAATALKVRSSFTNKGRLRCLAVIVSLEEAGEKLFTFLRFPAVREWRALRTTKEIKRMNEEFR